MTLFKFVPIAALLAASALLHAPRASAQAAAPAITTDKEQAAKEADGQLAAAGWLLMLDQQNWGGAYEAASQSFRNLVQIGQWMDSIPGVRAPFGAFENRTLARVVYKTTMPGRPDGEYVTAIFTTDFANKKGVEEIIATVRDADGKWRVMGYAPR
jgi:hypothetical protein